MTETPKRLRKAREAAGLTVKQVGYALWDRLPEPMHFSEAKVSRAERGEGKLDPFEVQFLAHLYGVSVADLDPDAAAALDQYRELLTHPEQGISGTTWLGSIELDTNPTRALVETGS